jgi:riboflavin synthase alpha subunit
MFTGLVETLGRVEASSRAGAGHRLALRVPEDWSREVRAGDSIAVSGVCLTAVVVEPGRLGFDLAEETRAVTTLGDLATGDPVNLERPLRLGAPVGGHLVLGHVDGVGLVAEVAVEGAGRRLTVHVPPALRPYLIPKGSVAVDGVSLTIAALDEASFAVALIPHTLAVTTLGARRSGDRVNLEMDVLGKYVRALLPSAGAAAEEARAFLGRQGLLVRAREEP